MYAVVQTGGKQYKAEIGQVLIIEKLDVPTGEEVRFEQVLLVNDDTSVTVGTPLVQGAVVTGKVVRQDRGPKIIVFKYKPKVRYRRKTGHRQYRTQVLVETINGVGRLDSRRAAEAETPEVLEGIATPVVTEAISAPAEPVDVVTTVPEQGLVESTEEQVDYSGT